MKLYPQQEDAYKAFQKFLASNTSIFILKGYAGTGKTTLVKLFYETIRGMDKYPILMATTGRAAKVLSEKTGYKASTIHKTIYLEGILELAFFDKNGKNLFSNTKKDKRKGIDKAILYAEVKSILETKKGEDCVLLIDESSLISSQHSNNDVLHFGSGVLMDDLLSYAELASGTKIVFIGDPAQLPPVEDKESIALSEDFFKKKGLTVTSYTLTEIIRQKEGSLILDNALRIRKRLENSSEKNSSLEEKVGEVEILTSGQLVSKYVEYFPRPVLGQSVIICNSNSLAQNYNIAIRKNYYKKSSLQKGDILQVVKNRYNLSNSIEALYNGDFIRVLSILGEEEVYFVPVWSHRNGQKIIEMVKLSFQAIEFKTEYGTRAQSIILTSILYSQSPALSLVEYAALHRFAFSRYKSQNDQKKEPEDYNYTLSKREKAEIIRRDPYCNALWVKFGYAITCHKAQGGEWDTVFVDYVGRTYNSEEAIRWCYTATTRAVKKLYAANIPKYIPTKKEEEIG